VSRFFDFYLGIQWLISLLIIIILGFSYGLGFFFNFLFLFFILSSLIRCFSSLGYFALGSLNLKYLRKPLPTRDKAAFFYMAMQWIFIVTTFLCIQSAIVPIQFTNNELQEWKIYIISACIIHFFCSFLPPVRIPKSWLFFYVLVSMFVAVELIRYHWPYKIDSAIKLINPFNVHSRVFQGGRSSIYNHHYTVNGQSYAVDLVPNESMAQSQMTTLTDFPCFNTAVYAPIDGTVNKIRNIIRDNSVGTTNVRSPEGNFVILKTRDRRFAVLAHFKKESIKVSVGQAVKTGDFLGLCGNSGNSTVPHIHLQIQSENDIWHPNNKTYPVKFLSNQRWLQPKRNMILDHTIAKNLP
tara:strand:+ start:418 stop:1476 length:1059 start_codon:yes stop_codon:yes gene_type:complete